VGQFKLRFTEPATETLSLLGRDRALAKRLKAVQKSLGLLERGGPRHPSLQTHPFASRTGPNGEKVFEAYAENRTPAAYRIFFCYGPDKDEITIYSEVIDCQSERNCVRVRGALADQRHHCRVHGAELSRQGSRRFCSA
jgi:hypothetical protein